MSFDEVRFVFVTYAGRVIAEKSSVNPVSASFPHAFV